MWPSLISKAKEGGLQVIQTYVFWNLHEPQPGQVRPSLHLTNIFLTYLSIAYSLRPFFTFRRDFLHSIRKILKMRKL